MKTTLFSTLIGAAIALQAGTGAALAQTARDRTIVPGERVGAITARSTLAQLRGVYGARNVKATQVPVGEGQTVPGITVFPGTRAEVQLRLRSDGSGVEMAQIYKPRSPWKTKAGIGVGTTAAEVERINGKPFKLYGFGWDYAGRTAGWNGGRLPEALIVDFGPTRKVSQQAYRQVLGDGAYPSDHPVMKRLRPVANGMLVRLK